MSYKFFTAKSSGTINLENPFNEGISYDIYGFLPTADITVSNQTYAIYAQNEHTLLLNSNLTMTGKGQEVVAAVSSNSDLTVIAANAAKKIKVSLDADLPSLSGYAIGSAGTLTVDGAYFNYSIDSTIKGGESAGNYGIYAQAISAAGTTFTGSITISSQNPGCPSESFGVYSKSDISAGDFTGKFKISSTGNENSFTAAIFSEEDLTLEKLSGKFDLSSTGAAVGVTAGTLHIAGGFTGSITCTAKGESAGAAYAFKAVKEFELSGISTGTVSATATGNTAANAGGINAADFTSASYNGTFNIKAVGNTGVSAAGIAIEKSLAINNSTGNFTVSAQNNGSGKEITCIAAGIIAGGDIKARDISGKWKISAASKNNATTCAYGLSSDGNIVFNTFSGNMDISAQGTGEAAAFSGKNLTAYSISGKINVTAKGENKAYGIRCSNAISINDLSKMTFSVKGDDSAYGIYSGDLTLRQSGLDLGKITINGKNATGVLADNVRYDGSFCNVISGTITASAKSDIACGFSTTEFTDNTVCSLNITATAQKTASGIAFGNGDLQISGSKITTKTTGKGEGTRAQAVWGGIGNNNIYIFNQSQLTGDINGDNGNDKVFIESGSKITGALRSVETLELIVNDAAQKKNALWNATSVLDEELSELVINFDYGMSGEYKLITKNAKIEWDKLFKNTDIELVHGKNEPVSINPGENCNTGLYTCKIYTKGNDLYLSAEINSQSEVNRTKISGTVETTRPIEIFTADAKIDIKAKDTENTAKAIVLSAASTLVLDNDISISNTGSVYGISSSEYEMSIYAANSAKTLKITSSGTEAYGYFSDKNLSIGGSKFLQNITVSANTGEFIIVSAIHTRGELQSDADFTGKHTITAKSENQIEAFAFYAEQGISLGNYSGTLNVTADSKSAATAGAFYSGSALEMEKLSGKLSIKATASGTDATSAASTGIYAAKEITLHEGFTGSVTLSSKAPDASAIAFDSGALRLYGKNTGKISITANGTDYAMAVAVNTGTLTAVNWSGEITVSASGNDDSVAAAVRTSKNETADFYGTLSGKLTVSAKSKDRDIGSAAAEGLEFAGEFISHDDITGVWKISADAVYSSAIGILSLGNMALNNISGNKAITAKAKNQDGDAEAYAFHSYAGFSAETISGNITVSGDTEAYGFCSSKDFQVYDLSGMTLKVSSKYGDACAIESGGSLLIGNDGLNFGKITVNALDIATGISIAGRICSGDTMNNRLTGTVSVISKQYGATGIEAFAFCDETGTNEVICSANISVTGFDFADAIAIDSGNLVIENAKISAKVTDKESADFACAVYCTDENDNIITISGKSQLTGNIRTDEGNDKVSIESGSKLTGNLSGVETLELIVNDAAQKKNALWNATSDIDDYLTSLEIDFAYGMSGEFLLATKKSDFEWSEIPKIELNVNDTTTVIDLNTNNMCSIDGFDFTLKGDGGKLILAVTEILK